MSEKRPIKFLLEDILIAADEIEQFTKSISFEEFSTDRKTINAVIRSFEVIGEAANRLPDNFKEVNSSVDWFRIRGFRNKLVHDYVDVNLEIIWDIRTNYLPELRKDIKHLFDALK